jgi:hypothetical protein
MGWSYSRTGRYSFLARGIGSFLRENPGLTGRKDQANDEQGRS